MLIGKMKMGHCLKTLRGGSEYNARLFVEAESLLKLSYLAPTSPRVCVDDMSLRAFVLHSTFDIPSARSMF